MTDPRHYDQKRLHEIRAIVLKVGFLSRGQALALIEQLERAEEVAKWGQAAAFCQQSECKAEDTANFKKALTAYYGDKEWAAEWGVKG